MNKSTVTVLQHGRVKVWIDLAHVLSMEFVIQGELPTDRGVVARAKIEFFGRNEPIVYEIYREWSDKVNTDDQQNLAIARAREACTELLAKWQAVTPVKTV